MSSLPEFRPDGSVAAGSMVDLLREGWTDLLAILALALIVYQPWTARALPLTDFGTFLPLLNPGESLWSQAGAVTRHYMNEGRLCVFPYLLFVFAGNAFGMWAPGWYWTYFALNTVVILLGWLLLRRTGISRVAALVALGLWTTMAASPEVWIRPTGEPIALGFFLVAMLAAVNYGTAEDWRRRASIIALCSVGVVFSKEMLVVLLPAAWLLSRLAFNGSTWQYRDGARRDWCLLVVVSGAVALSGMLIAYVAFSAPAGSYAARFGENTSPLELMLQRLEIVLIPAAPALAKLARLVKDPQWIMLLVLPSVVWIGMITSGVWKGRRRIGWPLAVSSLWMVPGILSYVPWPVGDAFYMVPFALGSMFGAAHALDSHLSSGFKNKSLAVIAAVSLTLVASIEARTVVDRHRLRAELNGRLVENIAHGDQRHLLLAAVRVIPEVERWGWARSIEGFARFASGNRVAASRDVSCDEARRLLQSDSSVIVVSRDRGCGKLGDSSVPIEASTYRSQWPWLWEKHLVVDRIYVTRGAAHQISSARIVDKSSVVRAVQAPL